MKILIFIPCYNCSNEIKLLIEKISKLNFKNFDISFLFIDNKSSDNTLKSIVLTSKKFNLKNYTILINKENYGVGGSHKIAIYYAIEHSFDFICVLHGDAQSEPNDIEKVFDQNLLKHNSAALGSRFMSGSKRNNYSILRTWGNIIINLIYSFFLLKKISDLGSGLNFYSVNFLKSIDFESFSDGHNFSHFLLLSLITKRQKIHFFPINWYQENQVSNVNLLEIGFQSLKVLPLYILYRFNFIKQKKEKSEKKNREYEKIKQEF